MDFFLETIQFSPMTMDPPRWFHVFYPLALSHLAVTDMAVLKVTCETCAHGYWRVGTWVYGFWNGSANKTARVWSVLYQQIHVGAWSCRSSFPVEIQCSLMVDQPPYLSGWWFGTFYILPIYWEFHHPNWLSYFSEGWPGGPTTNPI